MESYNYAPQFNPYPPQTNPNSVYVPQPNPHAPYLNPDTPGSQPNPSTTNVPVPVSTSTEPSKYVKYTVCMYLV